MPKVCDLYCDSGMDTDKWCDAQVYIGIGRLPFTSLSPLWSLGYTLNKLI
jgi:hypothetical protein